MLSSETLELCVEGRRFSNSWCMCVVSHGYCVLGGGRDGGVGLYVCRARQRGLVACQEMPEHIPNAK